MKENTKIIIAVVSCVLVFAAIGLFMTSTANPTSTKSSSYSYSSGTTKSTSSKSSSSTSTRTSSNSTTKTTTKKIDHYCDASGCTKEGTNKVMGLNGTYEYYCDTHYNEMNSIIDKMETDVGKSSSSKHQCMADGCSKEGTNKIMGLNGTYEYYCSEHYREMEEIIKMLLGDD